MQSDKVFAIQRENGPVVRAGILKNFRIRNLLTGLASVIRRERIMPGLAQMLDNSKGEVLVGVKACHAYAVSFSRICLSISFLCART